MKSTKSSSHQRVSFSIRNKLFLLVVFSFALLLTVILWIVSELSQESAETTVANTLQRSERVLTTRLQSRFASIRDTAAGLSSDPGIRPRVYESDTKALQARMSDLQEQHQFDLLMFTDQQGNILARSDRPETVGRSTRKSSLFRSALSGTPSTGFMKRGSDLLQIVALPVEDNAAPDIIRGAVGVGYLLNKEVAEEIQSLTGGQVALFTIQAGEALESLTLLHSTLGAVQGHLNQMMQGDPRVLQELIEAEKLSLSRHLSLNDEEFLGAFYPLRTHDARMVGVVAILASKTGVLAPFRKIINGCLLVGAIGLLVACIVAMAISRGVTGPIISLVDVTNRIRDGYFPAFSLSSRGDEIGVLERAVHEMGQALQRKAELEEYLASFSEELDAEQPSQAETTQVAKRVDGQKAKVLAAGQQPLPEGTLFDGRYRIGKLLGAGGMGMVYSATDEVLEELVALKMLLGEDISEEDEILFKREIKLARKISHHNIVRTYDFGLCEDKYYISMEFVPGYTLRQFVETFGPLELTKGLIMARQICAALNAAHLQGVVHRDLKAGNIVISRRGVLKIMDFGIAIAVQPRAPVEHQREDSLLGALDHALTYGTPLYMAPEQIRGREQDHRVDIYAMGVLLFFMFSGAFPVEGKHIHEIASHHLSKAPRKIRRLRSELPKSLEEIINRALAKEPGDRFQSARELGNALGSIAATAEPPHS